MVDKERATIHDNRCAIIPYQRSVTAIGSLNVNGHITKVGRPAVILEQTVTKHNARRVAIATILKSVFREFVKLHPINCD